VTCTVQRATTIAGPSNWIDYVQHEATNATMALRVHDANPPSGMMLVPAGSFQMGDNLGDGYGMENPVHSVYVSSFYMDCTEVSWSKWIGVRNWAVTNGYQFGFYVSTTKPDSYPVGRVDWFDAVKWCNARSEKEGRSPVYYIDAEMTQVYRSGEISPHAKWSAGGYRLPTEAEWEKAARGGLSGHRFPWGDTIQHSLANYCSHLDFPYDTSPTQQYNPLFVTGNTPYTSPVGYFLPNGYGLYDMTGNVIEWCWDYYAAGDYATMPIVDPRGPDAGSDVRVIRGASWEGRAFYQRCAYRQGMLDQTYSYSIGFRTVICPQSGR